MQRKFQIGDKVELVSGGMPKTVEQYQTDSMVICVWEASGGIFREAFVEQTLKKYERKAGGYVASRGSVRM